MPTNSMDAILAATKLPQVGIFKTLGSGVSGVYNSLFAQLGNPGPGTLAIGNTANGVVPTQLNAGYPQLNAMTGDPIIYQLNTRVTTAGSSGSCLLYDRVFAAGAYAFNANVTLTAQPAIPTARLNRSDITVTYEPLELWVEHVTASTGIQSVTVGYTNENGVAGRTTGPVSSGAVAAVGRCFRLPLQAGDKGIQRINSVQGTVATAGTFNVMLLKPIWYAALLETRGLISLGCPYVGNNAALYMLLTGAVGSSMDLIIDIAHG